MLPRPAIVGCVLLLALSPLACKRHRAEQSTPVTSALVAARGEIEGSLRATLRPEQTWVTFEMKAPLENIFGEAAGATTGELSVDPRDLTRTTGLVRLDLKKLVLYQQKRANASDNFGVRARSDLQNEHAKTWFEISPDVPPEIRKKNEIVEFRIDRVTDVSAADITKLSGPKREATFTVIGDLRLHQRVARKTVAMKGVFEYEGARPKSIHLTTVEPFPVSLEEHDVRPRKAFQQLAEATFETLGAKVDKTPKISLDLRADLAPVAHSK